MTMDAYLDVQASLLKVCKDYVTGSPDLGFDILDFDTHATIEALPARHLIGIAEYQMENDQETYYVDVLMTICTQASDNGLKILRPLAAEIFKDMRPGKQFSVVSRTNVNTLVGTMTVMNNVKMLPIGRANSRPIQMMAVRLAVAFASPP